MKRWLLIVSLLILYGSLYPFDFVAPADDALAKLFELAVFRNHSVGDVLGNIALFVPFGFLSGAVAKRSSDRLVRLIQLGIGGVALALISQVLQVYVPTRDPVLTDVLWNALGLLLGASGAWLITASVWEMQGRDAPGRLALLLIVAWFFSELVPLVPSIDFQQFKNSLKPLFLRPEFSLGDSLLEMASVSVFGELLLTQWDKRNATRYLIGALAAVFLLKILVVKVDVDLSLVIGWSAAVGIWSILNLNRRVDRSSMISMALLAALAVAALEPFQFSSEPKQFNWIPFSSLLEGSMLANVQALSQKLFLYAGLLWLVMRRVPRMLHFAIALAFVVGVFELMQLLVVGRVSSIDEPLLIIGLGFLFKQLSESRESVVKAEGVSVSVKPVRREASAESNPEPDPGGDVERKHFAVLAAVAVLLVFLMALAISLVLRMPGVPYNVKELFLGGGSFLYLMIFGLGALWIGVGAYWVGMRAAGSRFPLFAFPLAGVAVSLVSLILLSGSVTQESINDVAGSTNVYWFVTEREIWGSWWRELFLGMGPDIVSFLERPVRYAALYGPIPASLGLGVAFWLRARTKRLDLVWGGAILLGFFSWLFVCKLIAFDWSSTDNLNELVARSGGFGLGGGVYLYALLGLTALNALGLLVIKPTTITLLFTLVGAALTVPLGWVLLGWGLEPAVEKYGTNFSGVQFLLGPDRKTVLPDGLLFLRWAVLYLGMVGIMGAGLKIGKDLFGPRQGASAGGRELRASGA